MTRVVRLLELHAQASALAETQPVDTRAFGAVLREWAYVYKRSNCAEQGEYHYRLAGLE